MDYNNEDFYDVPIDLQESAENSGGEKLPEGFKDGGIGDRGKRFKSGKSTGYRKTKERIAYARALIEGLSQRKAFIKAFPDKAAKYKTSSIDVEASAIFNDPKFQEEIYKPECERIEAELTKQYQWSRGKAVKMLVSSTQLLHDKVVDEIQKDPEQRNTKEVLQEIRTMKDLIAELNSMHGYNKQNIDIAGGVTIISGEDDLED